MDKARAAPQLIAILVLGIAPLSAIGQVRLSLERAASRTGRDYTPTYVDRSITVSGVVSTKLYRIGANALLPIQDASNHGFALTGSESELSALRAGDRIEASGIVTILVGMPVLKVATVTRIGTGQPPAALRVGVDELRSFGLLAVLVTTESLVTAVDISPAADVITIGYAGSLVRAFLPKVDGTAAGLGFLGAGDRARVTGILVPNLDRPRYDGAFAIMMHETDNVSLVERRTFLPPLLLVSALGATSFMLFIWWVRERRMAIQRRSMRIFHSLSEEIIAASTPADLAKRLAGVLPRVTAATSVRLYLFNLRTRSLERVVSPVHPEPVAFAVDAPPPGLPTGVAVCFRNRRLLSIPDTRRTPFLKAASRSDVPRAALFVPMFAHQELLGVLELSIQERPHFFTREEQAAAQHIGNQVATALKLQEQQMIREQLFRSEKLAATGQLISGVAAELRAPLDTILALSTSLAATQSGGFGRDLRALSAEARHASEIVSRLVSFARPEDSAAKPIEVNELLGRLLEFRQPEWKKQGLHVHSRLSADLIFVHGAQGQLEQVFLNLLVHAEQCAEQWSHVSEKSISIATSLIARRILVEIAFPVAANGQDTLADDAEGGLSAAAGLAVCRGILQTHGGEIYYRTKGATAKFEVELPVEITRTTAASREPAKRLRPITALVVDPDVSAQRLLVVLLSNRAHRAVPVSSSQEAVDLVQRLRFDCVFFAASPANPNWMDMFERIRVHTAAIVLVTDGFDPELHRSGSEHLALARPVQDADLDEVLDVVADRADSARAPR